MQISNQIQGNGEMKAGVVEEGVEGWNPLLFLEFLLLIQSLGEASLLILFPLLLSELPQWVA
jgi:hypothetical protein